MAICPKCKKPLYDKVNLSSLSLEEYDLINEIASRYSIDKGIDVESLSRQDIDKVIKNEIEDMKDIIYHSFSGDAVGAEKRLEILKSARAKIASPCKTCGN